MTSLRIPRILLKACVRWVERKDLTFQFATTKRRKWRKPLLHLVRLTSFSSMVNGSWSTGGSSTIADRATKGRSQGKTCARLSMPRSEEHTSELQSRENLVCRLLLEKKKKIQVHVDQTS